MRHLDLFSGIGGFALAMDRVWDSVEHIFCDNDSFAQLVLQKHWPQSKLYENIRDIQHEEDIDIVTGGFPCQPFSQAGRRKGTADDRYLWPEMLRVIREVHPRWVVAENVSGLVTWNGGMVFEQVCSDLEAAGYEVQPFIIPACAVNAPHRRDRVWFVAHSNSDKYRGRGGQNGEADSIQKINRKEIRSGRISGTNQNATNSRQQHGKEGSSKGTQAVQAKRSITAKEIKRFERTDWNKNWTEVATELCGIYDGFSGKLDGLRLEKYASLSEKLKGQDLPALWQELQSEKVRETFRGRKQIPEQEVLLAILQQLLKIAYPQDFIPFKGKETSETILRIMQGDIKLGCSPQGQEYQEQQAKQSSNDLPQLSYEIALAGKAEWEAYTKYRNPRLKALGNAIVPQVAEEIFKRIKEVE